MTKQSRKSRSRHRSSDNRPPMAAPPSVPCPEPVPEAKAQVATHSDRWAHCSVILVVIALCSALYSWTADFPMVFDDYVYLQTNPLVKDAHSFWYLSEFHQFANLPAKLGLPTDLATNFILRPVVYATFHLNYLFDGLRPRWFRLVNIGIHTLNGLLLYALLMCLLRRSPSLPRHSAAFIAATAAVLFVVHPLATESVTYIVQRFTSLGAFFYLLTLWLHFAAGFVVRPTPRLALRTAATVAMVLGMLSKECCFTAPVIAVLLDWLVVRTPLKLAVRTALPLLLCLPIIPILVVLTAWTQNGGALNLGEALNVANLNAKPWGHWEYLVTQFTVVVSYLRRLVWPSGLNLDPEWPVYSSLLAWPVLRALLVIVALVAGAGMLYRRSRKDARCACVLAFILWFFVSIAVSSGLVPLPDLMAEHRCYLPSVGVFGLFACLLDRWRTGSRGGRWLAPSAVVAAACALGCATWQRNQVWRSPVALWEDTSAKSPGNARAWGNLGAAYCTAERYEESARCFQKAIRIEPRYETAYLNLTSVLNALHRSRAVLETIDDLLRLDKSVEKSADVQCNRSIAMIELGQVDEGMRILNAIVRQRPDHRMSHMVLGMVYSQTNQPRQAMEQYRLAQGLAPEDPKLAPLIHAAEVAANATVPKQNEVRDR